MRKEKATRKELGLILKEKNRKRSTWQNKKMWYNYVMRTEEQMNGGFTMDSIKINNKSTFDTYIFVILVCIEILMSFTFLGYIHIPPISVTFAYIPILIAACLLGTAQSTILGAVFGLASMYKSSAYYVMPADMIFSPLLSGNPVGSIFLTLVSRITFGFVLGLIFSFAKKSRHTKFWTTLGAAVATRLHAFFVYLAMGIFFPRMGYDWKSTLDFHIGDIILILLCIFLVEIVRKIYSSERMKKFKNAVDHAYSHYVEYRKRHAYHSALASFLISMTILATVYFYQRTAYMIGQYGIAASDKLNTDLIHLQIQFMLAFISLNVISLAVLVLNHRYTTYQKIMGENDPLTGIMGRRIYLGCCERILKSEKATHSGWFLFIDVDDFKEINDTFGHMTGDEVLGSVAKALEAAFNDCGLAGRLGGDEFSAIIEKPIEKRELEHRINAFSKEISTALPASHRVSCSIGAHRYNCPADLSSLMEHTDAALYEAKSRGKNCYVIYE